MASEVKAWSLSVEDFSLRLIVITGTPGPLPFDHTAGFSSRLQWWRDPAARLRCPFRHGGNLLDRGVGTEESKATLAERERGFTGKIKGYEWWQRQNPRPLGGHSAD